MDTYIVYRVENGKKYFIEVVWRKNKPHSADSMYVFQTQTPGDKICVFTTSTLKNVVEHIKNSKILNKYKWKLCLVDITHNPNGDNEGRDV